MNPWLRIYGYVVALSCYITVLLTFVTAYFNNMRTLVTINDYGEANIEAVILLTSIPIILKEIHVLIKTR